MGLKTKYNQSTLQDIIDRDNDEAGVEAAVREVFSHIKAEEILGPFVVNATGVGCFARSITYLIGVDAAASLRWYPNHRPFSFIDEETVVVVNYERTTHRNLKEALIYARLIGVEA